MPYETFDIDDFDDQELIYELRSRGYRVSKAEHIEKTIQYFSYGNVEEAMIYLERAYPELHGLHKMIRKDI